MEVGIKAGLLRGAIIGLGNIAVHGHLPGWLTRRDIEIVAVMHARRRPEYWKSRVRA